MTSKKLQELLEKAQGELTLLYEIGNAPRITLSSAEQSQQPASLLLADLDHFKEYNDRVGHLGGDKALKAVSHLLKETARSEDYVARFGGEEFALIQTADRALYEAKSQGRNRVVIA